MSVLENIKPGHYFITGTDTDIGKTFVSEKILSDYKINGLCSLGLKPIASGCQITSGGLRNDDALRLQAASSIQLPYEEINPFPIAAPISPNLAENKNLTIKNIVSKCKLTLETHADIILIEGVGGWLAPLNQTETISDLALAFDLPVILVVGIKLGCLNHTLLTWNHMNSMNIKIAGWIANCIDPNMIAIQKNIDTLTLYLQKKPLAIFQHSTHKNKSHLTAI